MKRKLVPILVAFLLIVIGNVNAQFPFESGNIVVVRVGNGETLSPTGNRVFLDEYDPSGSLVQSIPMPSTGANKLVLDGTDELCGYLNRSADNQYLTLTGFDATPGSVSSLDESDPASINRMVAVVDINASIDLTTRYNNVTRTPRGVCSDDGINLWLSAPAFKQKGTFLYYGTKGSSENSSLITKTWNENWSEAPQYYNTKIFPDLGKNILFYSWYSKAASSMTQSNGMVTYDSKNNLPKTAITNEGNAGSQFEQNCDFVFLDQTSAQNHIDVTYSVKPSPNGLTKQSHYPRQIDYSKYPDTIIYIETYDTDLGCFSGVPYTMDSCKYYGITLDSYTKNTATLYATRYNSISGRYELVKITDNSGWNKNLWARGEYYGGDYSIQVLASASSGTAFRGVAMAPVSKKPQYLKINNTRFDKKFQDSTFTLPSKTTAGLKITYTANDAAAVSITNDTVVTILKADTTDILATQAGNNEYLPMETYLTLMAAKSPQYVKSWVFNGSTYTNSDGKNDGKLRTFTVPANQEDFDVVANLNSKLDYYYYSSDEDIVEVDGNTFTLTGETGTAVIYVIQNEIDDNYELLGTKSGGYAYNYFNLKVTEATGINETEVGTGLQLYPNPVKGNSLTLSYPQTTEATSLKIYSISGTLLLQQDIEKGSTGTGLNVNTIPAGIYLLKMGNNTVKFVKE